MWRYFIYFFENEIQTIGANLYKSPNIYSTYITYSYVGGTVEELVVVGGLRLRIRSDGI